jgi:hypothetical protein
MIKSFPKIFTLGQRYTETIFSDPVEVTEKLDGSQFSFGKINGELHFRSKGKVQLVDAPDKMFRDAINYVVSIQERLPNNVVFNSEMFNKPKHNSIAYERMPRNGLALFAASHFGEEKFFPHYEDLKGWADRFEVDAVPLLYHGIVRSLEELMLLVKAPSYLGGIREGVVVKNYHRPFMLGGMVVPLLAGKFVSEAFKEIHQDWKKENTGKGRWQAFLDSYRTEARWNKAIQHFREDGKLTDSPKDIGPLIKEIQRDITEEEKEAIMAFLWKEFSGEVFRKAIAGFPEYYKTKLAEKSFEESNQG